MRELETERLKLRYITAGDTEAIFNNWASDPEVARYVTWYAHESIAVTEHIMKFWLSEYEEDNCYRYGIERKSDGELMGMIDVVGYHHGNPVIGYCSGRKYWNNGYMTEALKAVIAELFSDGYETIVIEAMKDNIASNRVIEKSGFEFVNCYKDMISEMKREEVVFNSYRLRK
ncbi:MAG: GNAT family N-acetyltransferase [Ruminiclostridium sp.]|nr:GNAT family N-acetyltransferase [Ruminiclostridium sp.]